MVRVNPELFAGNKFHCEPRLENVKRLRVTGDEGAQIKILFCSEILNSRWIGTLSHHIEFQALPAV